MPTVNAGAMAEHLEEINVEVVRGAHAVVVRDGAGRHQQGERLRVHDNITALPLPACSPALNPMESIGDDLRGNKLSRHVAHIPTYSRHDSNTQRELHNVQNGALPP